MTQNIYDFADGDIDIIELCGYNRDFEMPLAYDYFLSNHRSSYDYFHDSAMLDEENPYNITKVSSSFSPHWVYYNKPQAYKEAGITPEELTAMLPKYKQLGILSEEALTALENKIKNYK